MRSIGSRSVVALLALVALAGCEEERITTGSKHGQVDRRPSAEEEPETALLPPPVDFQETEFMESDRSRDPFRSFAKAFVQEGSDRIKSQRQVVLGQYTVDELRLAGIVTRIEPPRPMLVDPTGLGHFVTRGQFIGRPTVVQPPSGTGAAYEVNWRVDRVRDGDIVLIREDPANPDVPSATRVIALRTDDEQLVAAGEERAANSSDTLDRQVEELKRRLESMEQKPTVEVRELPRASGAPEAPREPAAVVKAPRTN